MGKGSSPRPYSVSKTEYDQRFETIFGKNKEKLEPAPVKQEKPALDHEKTKRTK